MTFVPVSSGDQVKASVTNGNYRHMGRAGLSSFYPMDTLGNYASQDLGETGKEWANLYLTGQVKGNLSVEGGISTDGKETIKRDVLSASYGTAASGTITIYHGRGGNLRGYSNPFFTSVGSGVTFYVYSDNTNVYVNWTAVGGGVSGTCYVVIDYV